MELNTNTEDNDQKRILATFINENSESLGTPFDLPTDIDAEKLQQICNALLQNVIYVI